MGNCASTTAIIISFDRNNLFYYTGEIVSGKVDLYISEGQVEADEVAIKLLGEIGYTTNRTNSSRTRQRGKRREYHHIPFYIGKVTLVQPNPGEKELILNQGQHSWTFQFQLPDNLPPTLNLPQTYPHVRYYLQVIIDKSWYKPNTRENKYITVYPHVNLLKNPQCLLSTIFGNENRKEIILKGTLTKLGYVPGEIIHMTYTIENPQQILIERVDVSMIQGYRISRARRGFTLFQTTLPNIINRRDQLITEQFSLMIPPGSIPPTYQFQGLTQNVFVNIHYFLRLAVKVAGIFTNFNVDIPIIFGTEPYPDLNQQQTFNPLMVSYCANPEQTMFHDEEHPTTSDSVHENIQ